MNLKLEKISDSLDKASEMYSNQVLIRASINAIPVIGGSLDLLLSSKGQEYTMRRIEGLISILNDKISALDNSKIDFKF
ncbi:MAG: hypothetical protein AAGF89_16905, partial [Bacteroidota bacterium]